MRLRNNAARIPPISRLPGLLRRAISGEVVPPLGPTSASVVSSASPGTFIAAITGLAAGEMIDAVTPNDGRLALDSTRRNLIVGLSALSAGTIAATLTSNAGRTLAMTLTVSQGVVSLDAPIPVADKGTTIAAFGNARMVADWASPSVTGKNSDNNATFQNGFDSAGREIVSAVPSNAAFVEWIDQNGSGLRATATGSPVMKSSDVAPRFATQDDPGGSGQQIRLTDAGGTGINLAAASHVSVTIPFIFGSGETLAITVMHSPNSRIARAGDLTGGVPNGNDPLNGQNTRNNLFTLGLNANNRFQAFLGGGGSGVDNASLVTNGGTSLTLNGKNSQGSYRYAQAGQIVTTWLFSSTRFREYENGVLTKDFALTAQQTADLNAGACDNPLFAFGAVFATGSAALATTNRYNGLLGGIVIEKNPTLAKIRYRHTRMSLIGQQHLAENLDVVMGWLKDIVYFKNANASTGRATGVKGFINFLFNIAGGFTFNYTDPVTGMKGIRASDNTPASSFQSDESFDWSRTGFTLIDFGKLESGAANGNVQISYALTKGNPQADTSDQAIMMLGHHHSVPAFGTKPANGKDPTGVMGRRKLIDLVTTWLYDFDQQTLLKYNYWLGLIYRKVTEVINTSQTNGQNLTLTAAVLENKDPAAPFKLDNPVKQMLPDNVTYVYKYSQEQLMIAVHEPSTVHNYDNPSPSTIFTARNRLYVSGGAVAPIGHMDGSKGVFDNAPVMHGDGTERIQSCAYQNQAFKDRGEFAFFPYPAPELMVRKLAANWHKVQEAA